MTKFNYYAEMKSFSEILGNLIKGMKDFYAKAAEGFDRKAKSLSWEECHEEIDGEKSEIYNRTKSRIRNLSNK